MRAVPPPPAAVTASLDSGDRVQPPEPPEAGASTLGSLATVDEGRRRAGSGSEIVVRPEPRVSGPHRVLS
jgi:hypothetical protein